MLRFFRAFAKSWFGPLIMGVLVIAFGILGGGVRDVLRGHIANAVVEAGDHDVTAAQFQKIINNRENEYLQQTGQPFPLEEAIREGADKDMLASLAQQASYSEMLSRSGIRPSDEVVAEEVRNQAESGHAPELAAVFDSVTGRFNADKLKQMLASSGISVDEFQHELADSIADQDFGAAMRYGFQPPRIYAALQAALLLESRDVTYFVIPASSVPVPPKPTDDQLKALIEQFKDRLMLPERRKLEVVRISAKAIAPTIQVAPAAVEQQFEAKKDTYGKPETRTVIEIPLNDPGKAAQVEAALKAGQDPNAVAKSVGVDAAVYTDQPEAAIVDHKAAVAAFAMQAGQVSGPVQGDFKTVILEVTKVTPGEAPDLNAAKAQITQQLQLEQAQDRALDLSNKFDDLRQGGASIQDAAAKLGLTVDTVGPVTADGKDLSSPQPDPNLTPKVLATAFQLPQGGDSDVSQDADKGEYFAVHVDQVLPPAPPGLDEKGVREFLTQAYYQQTIVGALDKDADAAEAALGKGQTIEAVAATYHAQVAHQVGMTRAAAQSLEKTFGQPFLAAAFAAKPSGVFHAGSDAMKGLIVARLDAIHPGDPKQVAAVLEQLRQRNADAYLKSLEDAVQQASVQMIHPQTNIDLARNAMGADAAMIARASKPQPAGDAPHLAQ
jgi:peptidyl-prolyl cis-trans isomerase D